MLHRCMSQSALTYHSYTFYVTEVLLVSGWKSIDQYEIRVSGEPTEWLNCSSVQGVCCSEVGHFELCRSPLRSLLAGLSAAVPKI